MNVNDVLASIPRPPHWSDGHGSFRLHLRDTADRGLTPTLVRQTLREEYLGHDGRDPTWPYPGRATVYDDQDGRITIEVDQFLELEDPRGLFTLVVGVLERDGWQVELELEPYRTTQWPRRRTLAAGLTIRGDLRELDDAGRPSIFRWAIPLEDTAEIVRTLGARLIDPDVPSMVVQSASGLATPWRLAVERLPFVIRSAIAPTDWRQETEETWTGLVFGTAGHVIAGRRRHGASAVEDAMALVPTIEALAPMLDHAMVRDVGPHSAWQQFVSISSFPPKPPAGTWITKTRPLEAEYVPDAYGIQLLTDTHLDRAHDLSRWTVRQVAPGRHLVVAEDLEQWYRGDLDAQLPLHDSDYDYPYVDDDTLARARRDFGEMIITEQQLHDEFQDWIAAGT